MMIVSTDKENLLLFLDTCSRIEMKCAEIYHFYGELFCDNHDVARLWKKTAMEEENHAHQVQLAIKMIDNIAIRNNHNSLERVYSIFNKLQIILEGIHAVPPNLITALKKSIDAEEHLASLHMDHAIVFCDQSTNDMFKALHDADRGHVSELKKQLAIETLAHTEMNG